MRTFLLTALAGTILAGAASAAQVVDLTDPSSYDIARTNVLAKGTLDNGVTWSITSPSGPLTYTAFDGIDTPLKDELDGIGINDDEVTNTVAVQGTDELLFLEFSQAVNVTGFHFLDLFETPGSGDDEQEMALVWVGQLGTAGGPDFMFGADEAFAAPRSGYSFGTADAFSNLFTFAASTGNDGVAFPDFALAGFNVEMQPIPLPAGALLLGTALAGFGAVARRRTR
jgi:hypothetical protein